MTNTAQKKNLELDFLVVGTPRSGTTWLHNQLQEHPDICVSRQKELHFFTKTEMFWHAHRLYGAEITDKQRKEKLTWDMYRQQFNHCTPFQKRGEVGTLYLYDPDLPQQLIKRYPNIKLLAVLRHPIERLYSHYMSAYYKKLYNLPSFENTIHRYPDFVDQSCYAKHIQHFLQVFPKEQLGLFFYSDLQKDSAAFIQQVYAFLGVRPITPPKANEYTNTRFEKKASSQTTLLRALLWRNPTTKLLYKSGMLSNVTEDNSYWERNTVVRQQLIDTYREDVQLLEKIAGKNLSHWLR